MKNKYTELASEIYESGIKFAFGIPGGGDSLLLIDALNNFRIPFYRTHHEASAAIMAGTIGKLTGNPGLSISIKGPGLTNMVPGIALCHFENFPMMAIAESYDENSQKVFGHKGITQSDLTKEITKGSYYYNNDISRFHSAHDLITSEVPGPVLLNLANGGESKYHDLSVNKHSTEKIINIIRDSKNPMIIAGSSFLRLGYSKELLKLNIPVFSTLSAKGIIDEKMVYSAGVYTGAGKEMSPESKIIKKSDLIIGLGVKDNELLNPIPFNCKSINFSLNSFGTSNVFEQNLNSNKKEIRRIVNILSKTKWGKSEIQDSKEKLNQYLLGENSFLPAQVFYFISEYFKDKYRAILDTGYFCTSAEHILLSREENHFLCAANSRYMGTSIPMGIATSLYDSSVPSIVCVGDGGVGMYVSDIKIAVENNLPIIIVLLSDGGFGSIRKRSIPNKLLQAPTNVFQPSWIKLFESFGIKSFKVKSLDQLNKKLTNWKFDPLFIECSFDETLYMNMVSNLRD